MIVQNGKKIASTDNTAAQNNNRGKRQKYKLNIEANRPSALKHRSLCQQNGYMQVEEKLETQQGKTKARRIFSRFCTPIFLEVGHFDLYFFASTSI